MERTPDVAELSSSSSESWELACAHAQSIATFPSSFTSVIRLLVNDFDRGTTNPSQFGNFFVSRLLRAPSFQAAYFFALKSFKPEVIGTRSTPFDFSIYLNSFSGLEHAVMLSLISLFRHAKRSLEPRRFDYIVPRLCRSANLGYFIGEAIPAIGAGNGMISTTFRVLGLIPLIKQDPERFEEYWQHLHSSKKEFDADFEHDHWKCTSLQIAGMLCQQVGLGLGRSVPLMRALTVDSTLLSSNSMEENFRGTEIWFRTLLQRKKSPDVPLPPKFYPNKVALDKLQRRAVETMTAADTHWLLRTKESVSPELTPQLYIGASPCLSAVPYESQSDKDSTPDVLRDTMTPDALDAISDRLLQDALDMGGEPGGEKPQGTE